MKRWQIALVWCVFLWALSGLAGELPKVIVGVPFALDYLRGMYPPDWRVLPDLADPLLETFRMSVVAICIASSIAAPLSFLAARTTSPHITAYVCARSIVNVARGIPTLLWAILFVSMVGLGPLAGVFALVTHCVGALTKHFSESIEAMSPRIVEVLEAMYIDGASRWQAIWYGLVPAVMPIFLSRVFYYFEWSIRVGTILGLVGAGGLGLQLTMSIRLFKRHETLAIILVILLIVGIIDSFSRAVRARLVEAVI